MRMTLLIIAALFAALPPVARAQENMACAPGELRQRGLCHQTVVAAPPAAVWALWTTGEGLRAWLAPSAAIDLRIGGLMEVSHVPDARLGDPGAIRNRVLSFLPERMLSIAVERAPDGFPHPEQVRTLWTVVEFEEVAGGTRVRVSMRGFGEGEAYEALHAFFARGNAATLERLRRHIEDAR